MADFDGLGEAFRCIAQDPEETPERRAIARRGLEAWLDEYRPSRFVQWMPASGGERHTSDLALQSDAEYDGWGSDR